MCEPVGQFWSRPRRLAVPRSPQYAACIHNNVSPSLLYLDHRLVTEFLESRIGLQEETDDDEEQAQEENDGDG